MSNILCKGQISEQVPPSSKYKGGYTKTTKCSVCCRTTYYEDHPTDIPCPNCGYKVVEGPICYWVKSIRNWYGRVIEKGYWQSRANRYN